MREYSQAFDPSVLDGGEARHAMDVAGRIEKIAAHIKGQATKRVEDTHAAFR